MDSEQRKKLRALHDAYENERNPLYVDEARLCRNAAAGESLPALLDALDEAEAHEEIAQQNVYALKAKLDEAEKALEAIADADSCMRDVERMTGKPYPATPEESHIRNIASKARTDLAKIRGEK